MGTKLTFSTTYHPQTDGQSECSIQTFEDMLRACVLDLGGRWDSHLPLIEFAYNNKYHSSIEMAHFESLYKRRCQSPICCNEVRERKLMEPKIVQVIVDKIRLI